MADPCEQLGDRRRTRPPTARWCVRTMRRLVWDEVPALVVPARRCRSSCSMRQRSHRRAPSAPSRRCRYTVLLLDRDYIASEMLPALAQQHFQANRRRLRLSARCREAGRPRRGLSLGAGSRRRRTRRPTRGSICSRCACRTSSRWSRRSGGSRRSRRDPRRRSAAQSPTTFGEPIGRRRHRPPAARRSICGPAEISQVVLRARPRSRLVASVGRRRRRPSTTRMARTAGAAVAAAGEASVRLARAAVNSGAPPQPDRQLGILGVLGASIGLLVRLDAARAASWRGSRWSSSPPSRTSCARRSRSSAPPPTTSPTASSHDEAQIRQVRRAGPGRRTPADRDGRADPRVRRHRSPGSAAMTPAPVAIGAAARRVSLRASATLIDAARIEVESTSPTTCRRCSATKRRCAACSRTSSATRSSTAPTGGWIGITRAAQAGDEVRVTVSDRGIGIAPADQARIFEPFYRAPDVVAAQIQGAGLGLSLVKRIVEAHGGRITRAERARRRQRVHRAFCRRPASSRCRTTPARAARRCGRAGVSRSLVKRLLLVEDEPGLVLTLTDRLTREGYGVETRGRRRERPRARRRRGVRPHRCST